MVTVAVSASAGNSLAAAITPAGRELHLHGRCRLKRSPAAFSPNRLPPRQHRGECLTQSPSDRKSFSTTTYSASGPQSPRPCWPRRAPRAVVDSFEVVAAHQPSKSFDVTTRIRLSARRADKFRHPIPDARLLFLRAPSAPAVAAPGVKGGVRGCCARDPRNRSRPTTSPVCTSCPRDEAVTKLKRSRRQAFKSPQKVLGRRVLLRLGSSVTFHQKLPASSPASTPAGAPARQGA